MSYGSTSTVPPITMGWRVRLQFKDPPGASITYQQGERERIFPNVGPCKEHYFKTKFNLSCTFPREVLHITSTNQHIERFHPIYFSTCQQPNNIKPAKKYLFLLLLRISITTYPPKTAVNRFDFVNQPLQKKLGVKLLAVTSPKPHKSVSFVHQVRPFLNIKDY